MNFRFFILSFLLLAFPFAQELLTGLARSRWGIDDVYEELMNQIIDELYSLELSAASGVHIVCVFPKNPHRLLLAGEESLLLVGVKNKGESEVKIIGMKGDIHPPNHHGRVVQNLRFQGLAYSTASPSITATWQYIFPVSQYLKGGTYDLVGILYYSIHEQPYESTFYNGTIEILEAHDDPIRVQDILLNALLFMFHILLGVIARSHILNGITKEVKKSQEVADRLQATRPSPSNPKKRNRNRNRNRNRYDPPTSTPQITQEELDHFYHILGQVTQEN